MLHCYGSREDHFPEQNTFLMTGAWQDQQIFTERELKCHSLGFSYFLHFGWYTFLKRGFICHACLFIFFLDVNMSILFVEPKITNLPKRAVACNLHNKQQPISLDPGVFTYTDKWRCWWWRRVLSEQLL